jgi:hypothetical protein
MLLSDLVARFPRKESLDALAELFDNLNEASSYLADNSAPPRMVHAAVLFRLQTSGEAAKRFLGLHEGLGRPRHTPRSDHHNKDIDKTRIAIDDVLELIEVRNAIAHSVGDEAASIAVTYVTGKGQDMLTRLAPALMSYSLRDLASPNTDGRRAAATLMMQEQERVLELFREQITAQVHRAAQDFVDATEPFRQLAQQQLGAIAQNFRGSANGA